MERISSLWRGLPTWARTVLIVFGLAFLIGLSQRGKDNLTPVSTAAKSPQPTTQKSLGERVFGSSLIAYTEASDGSILVGFEAWKMTKDSVEGDVKRFMTALAKESNKSWSSVTLSAYGTATDRTTGAQSKQIAYTISFDRDAAAKVVDWSKVDVRLVGHVEFAIAQLR